MRPLSRRNGVLLPEDSLLVYPDAAMTRRKAAPAAGDMLQGTLDMLVLRTLLFGPAHGHSIAHAIEASSEDVLQVEHGSLYPALHRLPNHDAPAPLSGAAGRNRQV